MGSSADLELRMLRLGSSCTNFAGCTGPAVGFAWFRWELCGVRRRGIGMPELTELPWASAALVLGHPSGSKTPCWSQGTLVAFLTDDECHVVDMQAAIEKTSEPSLVKKYKRPTQAKAPKAQIKRSRTEPKEPSQLESFLEHRKDFFIAAAWSPLGHRGSLLAVLDSGGRLCVLAPCDNSGFSESDGPLDLEESALVDLSEDFLEATGAESRAAVLDLCFWPSPLCIGKQEVAEAAALLCACRGSSLVIWKLGPRFAENCKSGKGSRLKHIALEPSVEITAVAASSIWQASDGSLLSLLAIASSKGQVHVKKVTVHGDGSLSIAPLCKTPVLEVVNAPFCVGRVGQIALLTDAWEEVEVYLAVGHGVLVSAAVVHCNKDGDLKGVSAYAASTPCHAIPVVSVLCAAAGILNSAHDSGYSNSWRADVLSMDSSGHAVLWQLPSKRSGTLSPGRLCSLVPGSWQNWLTAVEQKALRLDARMVRAAAREREARKGSSLFCGLAMSPSHCMLALQSITVSERTTQQRTASALLVTPVGSPLHSFNSMLRSLVQALHQSQLSFFYCSLWDVAESWQIQTQRKCTDLDLVFKSPKASSNSSDLMELCLEQIWDLADIFEKVAAASEQKADAEMTSLLDRTSAASLHKKALKGFVSKSLAERRPLSDGTETQRLLDRLMHLVVKDSKGSKGLNSHRALGDAGDVVRCQVQNACLEFARLAITSRRNESRIENHKKEGAKENGQNAACHSLRSLMEAATQEYWTSRLAKLAKPQTPLGPPTNLLAFLSDTDTHQQMLRRKCRVCQQAALPHPWLLEVSCGAHGLPLCQETLRPLLMEPHALCGFCGRCTEGRNTVSGRLGLCAWCAAPT
ncbi:GAS8 [Symbiodinium natans]|uniref:GAS8 protein n=1 Tax=Symbiodinium natans TaxID=878477 RepID=A0A812KD13_9DINO|nr:GAS8 [Symbiodinium natans]